MVWNYIKTHVQLLTFTQFRAECIAMFTSHTKKPKVSTAANTTEAIANASGEPEKTHSQAEKDKKRKKLYTCREH